MRVEVNGWENHGMGCKRLPRAVHSLAVSVAVLLRMEKVVQKTRCQQTVQVGIMHSCAARLHAETGGLVVTSHSQDAAGTERWLTGAGLRGLQCRCCGLVLASMRPELRQPRRGRRWMRRCAALAVGADSAVAGSTSAKSRVRMLHGTSVAGATGQGRADGGVG